MVYRFVALVIAAVVLAACSNKADFPAEIRVGRGGQAEAIAEFIDARYARLEQSLKTAQVFVTAVLDETGRPPAWAYTAGAVLYEEEVRSTRIIVDEFVRSPEGAYLSEQDLEFIKRLLDQREGRLEEIEDEVAEFLKTQGLAAAVREKELEELYVGGHAAKVYLADISDDVLRRCARTVRDEMVARDRLELWDALVAGEWERLSSYRQTEDTPSLTYLTYQQAKEALRTEITGPAQGVVIDVVSNVLGQSLELWHSGYVYTILEDSGLNDYIGSELLNDIHRRLLQAIREVELTAGRE